MPHVWGLKLTLFPPEWKGNHGDRETKKWTVGLDKHARGPALSRSGPTESPLIYHFDSTFPLTKPKPSLLIHFFLNLIYYYYIDIEDNPSHRLSLCDASTTGGRLSSPCSATWRRRRPSDSCIQSSNWEEQRSLDSLLLQQPAAPPIFSLLTLQSVLRHFRLNDGISRWLQIEKGQKVKKEAWAWGFKHLGLKFRIKDDCYPSLTPFPVM